MKIFAWLGARPVYPTSAPRRFRRPNLWPVIAILLAAGLYGAPALTAALVMFGSPHCPWCRAWESEIGAIYPKTVEARQAPLRRVDIDEPRPADLVNIEPVKFTPTFVLMVDGRDAGRIVGYPGEAAFWGPLGVLLRRARIPVEPASPAMGD